MRRLTLLIWSIMLTALASCGGDSGGSSGVPSAPSGPSVPDTPTPTPTVAVTGVTINKETLSLVEGESETLTATVSPPNATNKNITWKSSDTSIASIDANGIISAKVPGKVTITVTTADGNKTATMTLTVTINYILRQKKVLVALYEAMGGDSWMKKDGWKRDDVELKDWYGITMEGEHVVSINLSNNNLKGKLSASLVEDLVNTIGYLRDLDLSINDISGSIPPQIGNLSNLTNLNLGSNELTGTVPDELGKLSKLENLNISDNKLTGIISIDLQNSDMWKNLKEEPNLKQKDGIELKKETEGSTIDMQGGATHEGYQ